MALPPFIANGPFVDFNPGVPEREIEKYLTRPWREFAAKADAITQAADARIAALEARVATLERKLRVSRRRKPR